MEICEFQKRMLRQTNPDCYEKLATYHCQMQNNEIMELNKIHEALNEKVNDLQKKIEEAEKEKERKMNVPVLNEVATQKKNIKRKWDLINECRHLKAEKDVLFMVFEASWYTEGYKEGTKPDKKIAILNEANNNKMTNLSRQTNDMMAAAI